MSRENDRHQELLEAAKALAIHLRYVEEDDDGELVDLGEVSVEDDDDNDGEGMDAAQEDVQALVDKESELVEVFEGDVDLAIEYIGKILKTARPD